MRLFPSFGGYRYTSPYFYTPPKKRWWPFLTGCALGGVVVLVIIGRFEQPADSNDYRVSVYQTRGSQTHKLVSKKISKSATERAQAQPVKPPLNVVTAAEAATDVPATAPPEAADQSTPAPTAGGEPDEAATKAERRDAAHGDTRQNHDKHLVHKKSTKAQARRHQRDRDRLAPAPEEQTFAMSGPQPQAFGENYWKSGGNNWSAPLSSSRMSPDRSASASVAPLGGPGQRTASTSDWDRGGAWPNAEARSSFDNQAAAAVHEPAPAQRRAGRRSRSVYGQEGYGAGYRREPWDYGR